MCHFLCLLKAWDCNLDEFDLRVKPVECWTVLDGESSNIQLILQQAPIGEHSLPGACLSFSSFIHVLLHILSSYLI